MELGADIKSIFKYGELDLVRGHCSRCRNAACMIDSITTQNIPLIAYGLRYDHGNPIQTISKDNKIHYHLNEFL